MLFNSFSFALFFPIVTVLYFLLPHKGRWLLLLLASCFFYMFFKPEYILILGFTIVIDYYAGLLLDSTPNPGQRKLYLIGSLVANIGVLSIFKYYNFLDHNLSVFTGLLGTTNSLPLLQMALPIGLSFHTFQAMSYTIEVYQGNQKAERSFGIYALYVMFYPQLVAGPIERPQNMLHQFHERKVFSYNNAVAGLQLMLWGMFKKVVIADRLALITDPVFNDPHAYSASTLLFAAVLFSFQIYCDFSGYSDIALGSARVMGFTLMPNFNHPYKAETIAGFWRHWHMSLSTWFKDYVYVPLGGSRVAAPRMYFNICCVFILSGLWHGANWTFIVWGALHAFYMVFGAITARARHRLSHFIGLTKVKWLHKVVQQVTTFGLITMAWMFFRANSIWDALYIFRKLPQVFNDWRLFVQKHIPVIDTGIPLARWLFSIALILLLIIIQFLEGNKTLNTYLSTKPTVIRLSVYYALILSVLYLGVFDKRQFIYFQF